MEQFAAKMQEKMNDPEMKKGMEMMGKMSEGMAGSIDVKKTGESRTVAGFHCDEWVITMNTFTTMKECKLSPASCRTPLAPSRPTRTTPRA